VLAFGSGFSGLLLVTFEVSCPRLRKMQEFAQLYRPTLPIRSLDARATPIAPSTSGSTLRREGGELAAYSTGSQSSSRLMSLAGAHALVSIRGDQGIKAGATVER